MARKKDAVEASSMLDSSNFVPAEEDIAEKLGDEFCQKRNYFGL